jgi:hypothetical protein
MQLACMQRRNSLSCKCTTGYIQGLTNIDHSDVPYIIAPQVVNCVDKQHNCPQLLPTPSMLPTYNVLRAQS